MSLPKTAISAHSDNLEIFQMVLALKQKFIYPDPILLSKHKRCYSLVCDVPAKKDGQKNLPPIKIVLWYAVVDYAIKWTTLAHINFTNIQGFCTPQDFYNLVRTNHTSNPIENLT